MFRTHLCSHWRWLLFWIGAVLLLPSPAQATPAAPADTPVVFAAGNVEEWAAGAGLVYWANNCFADEFNPFAALLRKPAGGGIERTLEAIEDFARCNTYRSLLSSADGLYFYDASLSRIARMPLGEPYTPVTVKELTEAQAPTAGRGLVEAGDYLYWVHAGGVNALHRVKKDGSSAVETVANTGASPSDMLVVGATVYWTDSSGVWTISTNCAVLPCAGTQTQFVAFGANNSGYGLLYQFLGGPQGNYRVYWVQRIVSGANAAYQIRYRSCNQITVCTLTSPITFYGSTTNWRIGFPLLVAGQVYWTEIDHNTVNNNNGDVKRRAYNAPEPGADTLATGQARIDARLYTANGLLFFARRHVGIYTLALGAATITRDFRIEGMEVTQAIQNLANQAPLAAGKTTYVRVYATQVSGPNTANVEVRLTGTRNGSPLPGGALQPVNGVRSLVTGAGFDRKHLDNGWYFLLPPAWIGAGAVTLQVEVDPRRIHSDPNRDNNALTQPLTFQDQPPVCVWTVPVRTHTPLPSTNDPNFWAMVSQFSRRWPAPATWIFRDTKPDEELEVCWYGPFPYPCYGPYELEDGWGITNGIPDRDKVITSLWLRAQLSFNPDACDDIGAPVHFMGMVHPAANNGGKAGYASTVSNQSWVQLPEHTPDPAPSIWRGVSAGSVMAQELAHNYGRKHVNCGNPEDVDNSYPYPPCQLANSGPASYYGFDTTTLEPIPPEIAADFMSYASRRWVSDYTWRALMNAFRAVARTAPAQAAAGEEVFVAGMVDMANQRGAIAQVLVLPGATVPPATRAAIAARAAVPQHDDAPHAVYKLRLLDAGGAVLLERVLALTPLDDHQADSDPALFSDLFPPPAGQVAAIQLLADSTVITSHTPGMAQPAVAVQQPAAGAFVEDTLTIAWTASDPDPADRLLFTVQYSHDSGASWHTITPNLPGTPNPASQLTLSDLGALPGSGANTAQVRVLASDGYNTAIGLSQPFTLKNRPPEPVILTPVAGETFAAGPDVVLQGAATDAEDGGLPAAALSWQLDGAPAGSGPAVAVAGLAPGAHTATLAATDANNQTVTATVSFTVAPLNTPAAAAFVLDGACQDDGYAAATALPLPAYAGGSRASVTVARSDPYLWVCFTGLAARTAAPGAFASVRIDGDHSRDAVAQADDYAFLVGEDGAVNTLAGDGAGGFVAAAPGSLHAQVSAADGLWNAELRIDKNWIGGWDHLAGLQLGHERWQFQGDDYRWPHGAAANSPQSWGAVALGSQPLLTELEPSTAMAGAPVFILTVAGSNFADGAAVLWNGAPLPTAVIDAGLLTATVSGAQVAAPALVEVKVRNPAPGSFTSNAAAFVVAAPAPAVTALAPVSTTAGGPAFLLTVSGSNFAPDAQVLWNGTPLATQFIHASQVQATVAAELIANGQSAGVTVRNPQPEQRIASALPFLVAPRHEQRLYLPQVIR